MRGRGPDCDKVGEGIGDGVRVKDCNDECRLLRVFSSKPVDLSLDGESSSLCCDTSGAGDNIGIDAEGTKLSRGLRKNEGRGGGE